VALLAASGTLFYMNYTTNRLPNKVFLVQGYRVAHYGAALLSIIQAITNLVIGVSSLEIAPEHMKLNKDLFT
jgi:hypothetical protein